MSKSVIVRLQSGDRCFMWCAGDHYSYYSDPIPEIDLYIKHYESLEELEEAGWRETLHPRYNPERKRDVWICPECVKEEINERK